MIWLLIVILLILSVIELFHSIYQEKKIRTCETVLRILEAHIFSEDFYGGEGFDHPAFAAMTVKSFHPKVAIEDVVRRTERIISYVRSRKCQGTDIEKIF